jgi:ATPase subunit of ABC transporter with duplicated ATPase domains
VGYSFNDPHLSGITFSLSKGERIALENGSGKSTFIKAILGDESIYKTGAWYTLKREDIGYLDQHYRTLDPLKSVLETMSEIVPHWSYAEIRNHLNDFLFRKNEEVTAQVNNLSGGEKVRLSLAQIAAKTPQLLVLDEITNNLDLETKSHVIQVLKCYPGALMIVSHEIDFLKEMRVEEVCVAKWRS